MIKDVKIQVRTNINYVDKTNELMEHQYNGTQYLKNNKKFLRYKDNCKQDMINTWTTIKWSENETPIKILLIRQGATKMKNVFQEGYKHVSKYHSLNQVFEMEIVTEKIGIREKLNGGNICLNYNLKLNNQSIGDYILEIDYTFD